MSSVLQLHAETTTIGFKQLLLDLSTNPGMRANFLENPVNVLHRYGIKMGTKAELEMAIFIELTEQNLENLYTKMGQSPDDPEALKKYLDDLKHRHIPEQIPEKRMYT